MEGVGVGGHTANVALTQKHMGSINVSRTAEDTTSSVV